jgi:hypothetical protein
MKGYVRRSKRLPSNDSEDMILNISVCVCVCVCVFVRASVCVCFSEI